MELKYQGTSMVLLLRVYSFWLMTSISWSVETDLRCPKCIHMESASFYASLVKLPTDQLCTKEHYEQLDYARIASCPELPSGQEEKKFMCGNMRGNLTANIQTKLLGNDIQANVQGSLFYRDCILVDTSFIGGCQQSVPGPMEKAALQKLGISDANVTISNFQGSTCMSAPLGGSQELSTRENNIIEITVENAEYQIDNETMIATTSSVSHNLTSGSNSINIQSTHVVITLLFHVYQTIGIHR